MAKKRVESSVWSAEIPRLSDDYVCPFASSEEPVAVLLPITFLYIAKHSGRIDTEFMFYAKIANRVGRHIIVADEYCVPRQRATYASVEAEPGECPGFNVVVHKHPSGVKHFSSTDHEYINANNEVSILIESGKVAKTEVRRRVPCGAIYNAEAEILFYVPGADFTKLKEYEDKALNLIEEIKSKLVKETAKYPQYYYGRIYPAQYTLTVVECCGREAVLEETTSGEYYAPTEELLPLLKAMAKKAGAKVRDTGVTIDVTVDNVTYYCTKGIQYTFCPKALIKTLANKASAKMEEKLIHDDEDIEELQYYYRLYGWD